MDKSTNKKNNITISNNKGRLSKEEIERLVKDAEKYKDEDEAIRKKVEAKNQLEGYAFQIKNSLNDEKVKDKVDPEDRKIVEEACTETTTWLEANQNATYEEIESKRKSLEEKLQPIMMKIHQAGGGQGMPGNMPDMGNMGGQG